MCTLLKLSFTCSPVGLCRTLTANLSDLCDQVTLIQRDELSSFGQRVVKLQNTQLNVKTYQ